MMKLRIKESLNDQIHNIYLYLSGYLRKILKVKRMGTSEPFTGTMKLQFEDNFEFFDYNRWRIGQPWGKFHPEYPNQWYGEDSVYIENKHLVLDNRYQPVQLSTWDSPKKYDISYSVGLITSYESYGYGYYEFEAKLPDGVGLWPAIWLSCVDSWPPEIDITESYSDKNGEYKDKLESNFHFNLGESKTSSGARSHPIYRSKELIKFSLWWTKDFIKVYYNGYLVRVITSKDSLQWFRDKKMTIILNNGMRSDFDNIQPKEEKVSISKFEIYSVKYWI